MWSFKPSSFILNYGGENPEDEFSDITTNPYNSVAYKVVACVIFGVVSYTFLFPCNALIPLDRRTVAVLGAILCYCTRTFVFIDRQMNMLQAVDFDVLVLLASIMAINHLVVHLKETKIAITFLQKQVQQNPLKGFWLVSAASLIVAPFLTNDGVCLLFVQLILDAFESVKALEEQYAVKQQNMITNTPEQRALIVKMTEMPLETGDAFYFLLTLACSANIGSALTYTGNPQNMIVAEDATPVMPPIKFLGIMFLPTMLSWLITTYWIQRCWLFSKGRVNHNGSFPVATSEPEHLAEEVNHDATSASTTNPLLGSVALCIPLSPTKALASRTSSTAGAASVTPSSGPLSPAMTPRRRRVKDREAMMEQVTNFVSSPFPYMVLILLAIMIVMIFVNIMPIAALTCISAIVMVVALVFGNHWRGQPVWGEETNPRRPLEPSSSTELLAQAEAGNAGSHAPVESVLSRNERDGGDGDGEDMKETDVEAGDNMNMLNSQTGGAQRRKVSYSLIEDNNGSHSSSHKSNRSRRSSSTPGSFIMVGDKKNSEEGEEANDSTSRLLIDVRARSASNAAAHAHATSKISCSTGNGSNTNNQCEQYEGTHYMPLTREERIENINEFFEGLFNSIDYSLLLIFLGTFIVVANVDSTGIPRAIWQAIVGEVPFNTAGSVTGISLFVLISSQLLGNVAVVQLAKPNVEDLGAREKAYAWAVISFVATVGGNLTITGSAANIIVAEKASRIDPSSNIDFFRHYRVCFWVTLLCCALGALLITAEFQIDDMLHR